MATALEEKSTSKAGGWPRSPATSGDTCEPDESPRDARNGLHREIAARFSKSPAYLSAAISCRQIPLEPARPCLAERFWQALSSLSAPVRRATNISQFADSICCSIRCGQLYEGVRQRDCYTSVRLARCWAHPQLAAGRAAAPPQQIHHDAAAAPGRPPTEPWPPSRGRAQASRHSCGRRRLKRPAMPRR